jgi:nitric oxide reductase subunit B
MVLLDKWASELGATNYAALDSEHQAALTSRLQKTLRTNTYEKEPNRIVVDPVVAQAFERLSTYYSDVFSQGRSDYAIQKGALTDPVKLRQMSAFFWWTAWAASTNRPGQNVTYTQNWPHEPLIANDATGSAIVWSVISFVLLLSGIGGMVWYFASQPRAEAQELLPQSDPLLGLSPTPSQRSTLKFFFVVAALWVVQVALGAITAHYGVEGSGFYGIPLDQILPYSVTRMWHLQIGIFWIATSWLATGLYVAPAVSGFEPKGQRLGVNALFGALILVVVGSAKARKPVVLAWDPGLRIRRPGPLVANPPFPGPGVLAMADVACLAACSSEARSKSRSADHVRDLQHRDSSVLCCRAHVWPTQQSGDRRVLALVGGPSLGRGIL